MKLMLPGVFGICSAYLCFSYKTRSKILRPLKIAIDVGPKKPRGNLIFVHGWPDHGQLWRPIIEELKVKYRCVAIDLPGMGTDKVNAPSWGYSFPELVQMLNQTAKLTFKGEPVHIVGHDWGAVLANLAMEQDPNLYANYIGFDIPATVGFPPMKSIRVSLFIFTYQLMNIILFLMWQIPILSVVSDWLMKHYTYLFLEKGGVWNKGPKYVVVPSSQINYFYFHAWLNLRSIFNRRLPDNRTLFFISPPELFGTKEYKEALKSRTDGSAYIVVKHSHHWIMLDQHQFVMQHIEEFLEKYG